MARFGARAFATLTVLSVALPGLAQPVKAPPVQPPPTAVFRIARAASPIRIDGILDEAAWKTAAVVPLSYEWAPGDNVKPQVDTECLVTYDDRFFYVAFRAPTRGRRRSGPRSWIATTPTRSSRATMSAS
jgi:hypothetical protein